MKPLQSSAVWPYSMCVTLLSPGQERVTNCLWPLVITGRPRISDASQARTLRRRYPVQTVRSSHVHVQTWRRMETTRRQEPLRILVHLQEQDLSNNDLFFARPADTSGFGRSAFGCCSASNYYECSRSQNGTQEAHQKAAAESAERATPKAQGGEAFSKKGTFAGEVDGITLGLLANSRVEDAKEAGHRRTQRTMRALQGDPRVACSPQDLYKMEARIADGSGVAVQGLPSTRSRRHVLTSEAARKLLENFGGSIL